MTSRAAIGQPRSREAGRKASRRRRRASREPRHLLAVYRDRTDGFLDPGEGAQQAGLAAAVGADQRDQLAAVEREVGRLEPAGDGDGRWRTSDVMPSPPGAC